jgi:hypothetical protein
MHCPFREVLSTRDGDSLDLIDDQLVVLGLSSMQDDKWAGTTRLHDNVGCSSFRVWIRFELVAHPPKESFAFHWLVESVPVALDALLAERNPHSPKEWVLHTVNRDFQDCPDESVSTLIVRDDAEVVIDPTHLRLLLF